MHNILQSFCQWYSSSKCLFNVEMICDMCETFVNTILKGPQGNIGQWGEIGLQGPVGNQGPRGPPGPNGVAGYPVCVFGLFGLLLWGLWEGFSSNPLLYSFYFRVKMDHLDPSDLQEKKAIRWDIFSSFIFIIYVKSIVSPHCDLVWDLLFINVLAKGTERSQWTEGSCRYRWWGGRLVINFDYVVTLGDSAPKN